MPLLVPRPVWGQWLDPGLVDGAAALALVGPAEAGDLEAYPVSERVNNVRNNGPELLAPLPPEEPDPEAE
jgi:putative SOS response-associated peptidase YedK